MNACQDCDGREFRSSRHLAIHRYHKHGEGENPMPLGNRAPGRRGPHERRPPPARPDDNGRQADDVELPGFEAERPPEIAEPPGPASWREKLWGGQTKGEPQRPGRLTTPAERRPRRKRVPTDDVWSALWTLGGVALVRTGADVPVGNCLQFQSAIVGPIFDDAIRDTAVDRLVQPIAQSGGRLKKVGSVCAMPMLVFALERNPSAAPVLEPLLRQVIRDQLAELAPIVKAKKKRDDEYRKAVVELGLVDSEEQLDGGRDPVDEILAAIFPGFAQPAPAANGAAAPAA